MLNSDSSEDEGFYKPSIQIMQEKEELNMGRNPNNFQEALEIICENRPLDFIPRVLNSAPRYFLNHKALDGSTKSEQGQLMKPLPQKTKTNFRQPKQKRYSSLKEKYNNNPQYQLVYSKIPNNQEFSSYFLSLENTPDYNPNNFTAIMQQKTDFGQIKQQKDKLTDQNDRIEFNSNFQSGNLLFAFLHKNEQSNKETSWYSSEEGLQKSQSYSKNQNYVRQTYDCIMQNDTNTKGYNQWFYFSVHSSKRKTIRINIVNFIKKRLMFRDGVRPVGFSLQKMKNQGKQWIYFGNNITYGKSYVMRQQEGDAEPKSFYMLGFDLTFQYPDETIFLALNFPYTYSKMINHISLLEKLCPEGVKIQRKVLCHSISNNPIPYLQIQSVQKVGEKKILCLGRQHPGQTVGSFILESFLNQLVNKETLLKNYTFIVIPMLNVDGVIYGNFRTSLSGADLNRQWKAPNRWLHPEVFFMNKLFRQTNGIEFCIDFHGHSKKLNSFIYACSGSNPSDFRIYPYILSKKCSYFSLSDCTFSMTADKAKTARVNIYNQTKKPYIFTLETSFYGHTKENRSTSQQESFPVRWTFDNFNCIGKCALESVQTLLLEKETVKTFTEEVNEKAYLFEQWALQNRGDYGSESNPSEDELTFVERKEKVMSDSKQNLKEEKVNRKSQKLPGANKKNDKNYRKRKQHIQFSAKHKGEAKQIIEKKKSDAIINIQSKAKQKIIIPSSFEEKGKKLKKQQRQQKVTETQKMFLESKLNSGSLNFSRKQSRTIVTGSLRRNERIISNTNTVVNSNLFDPLSYSKMREQISLQLKKNQEQNKQLCRQRESPQILAQHLTLDTPLSMGAQKIISKQKAEKLKKQFQQLAPIYGHTPANIYNSHNADYRAASHSKRKSREKVYVIKENKVVRSFTRVSEDRAKINFQKDVQCRTMGVKNLGKNSLPKPVANYLQGEFQQQQPYKAKKMLKPLDIRKHGNSRHQDKGVFFTFI